MKIIPVPKKTTEKSGFFPLKSLKDIRIAAGNDRRVTKIALKFREEAEIFTAEQIKLANYFPDEDISPFWMCVSHGDGGESYSIDIKENGINVIGDGAAGAYYGIQTLRQMIKAYGENLPCCHIEDYPDMEIRGLYHDITRGKVPFKEQLYKIVDFIAEHKINHLQFYVEDAFEFKEYDGVMTADRVITAEELMAVDEYCYENFIDFTPSMSSFGHLYNLLQSEKYKHLCELENYQPHGTLWSNKMCHHTIDVSNPESIKVIESMLDQFVPLFRSKYFNICCDETFDLCHGRNSGKDSKTLFYGFVNKIINHVHKYGKTPMMWASGFGENVTRLPKNAVMLYWDYGPNPDDTDSKLFNEKNYNFVVCPGTASWSRFLEDVDNAEQNISRISAIAKKYGALGLLNTNWGDEGTVCPFNCTRYTIALGAERSWTACGELPTKDFEMTASKLLYDSDDVNIIDFIRTACTTETATMWGYVTYWYNDLITGRKPSPVCDIDGLKRMEKLLADIKALNRSDDPRYSDLILSVRAIVLNKKIALYLAGNEDYSDLKALTAEKDAWLKEFRENWLKDNKYGELFIIEEVYNKILTFGQPGRQN